MFSTKLKHWLFVPIFFLYCLSHVKPPVNFFFHERDVDDSLRKRPTLQPQRTDLLSRCELNVLCDFYDRLGEDRPKNNRRS